MKKNMNIVVFTCNWDGWSCVETAGRNRLSYPASVKVVRLSCLSRVHAGLMLKAIESGADGVMLLGCESNSCLYNMNEVAVLQQFEKARNVLTLLGLGKERLSLVRLPHGDGAGFVKRVRSFLSELERVPTVI